MTTILAIDPGPRESGWVLLNGDRVEECGHDVNDDVQRLMWEQLNVVSGSIVACEWITSYGMAVGKDVFQTCRWVGRFEEQCIAGNGLFHAVERVAVKLHLCGTPRAKDANVRQALIDRFAPTGGGKLPQVGTKKQPGPLYGVSGHAWAALGVAVTCRDTILTGKE